jgi:osmotically inducible protein OsmC
VDRAVAEQLVRSTERVCPYAKMARQGMVNVVALHVDPPATEGVEPE